MKTIEYKYIDKSDWAPGEWKNEPDKIQWLDKETKYPCLIVRGSVGALCGYVGINKKHPFYKEESQERDHKWDLIVCMRTIKT